jgi:hypothetical protein
MFRGSIVSFHPHAFGRARVVEVSKCRPHSRGVKYTNYRRAISYDLLAVRWMLRRYVDIRRESMTRTSAVTLTIGFRSSDVFLVSFQWIHSEAQVTYPGNLLVPEPRRGL